VAGVAGTKIQNQSSTLRENQELKRRYIYLLRSARPATTASNTTNTPMTTQAGVVSTTYVCVTVVAEVNVAVTVVSVITWGKADAVWRGFPHWRRIFSTLRYMSLVAMYTALYMSISLRTTSEIITAVLRQLYSDTS
jgi:hypothetical protein